MLRNSLSRARRACDRILRNRFLRNRRISTKVVGGFGAMLLVLAALGATSYLMFGRVQSNVAQLRDHSLAAVKSSTGVERAAFRTMLEEKNYLLENNAETLDTAKKHIAALVASLDKIDAIAEQNGDAELASQSQAVRATATKYDKLLADGVAAIKSNKTREKNVDAKGMQVAKEAADYMALKKAEFTEVQQALATVSRIEPLIWQTRYARQKLKAEKDDKHLQTIVANVQALTGLYDELEKLNPDKKDKELIAAGRKAAQTYLETARQHREEQKRDEKCPKLAEIDKRNAEAGDAAGKAAADYLADKQADAKRTADSVFLASEVAAKAAAARMYEKFLALTQEIKHWSALQDQTLRHEPAVRRTEEGRRDARRRPADRPGQEDHPGVHRRRRGMVRERQGAARGNPPRNGQGRRGDAGHRRERREQRLGPVGRERGGDRRRCGRVEDGQHRRIDRRRGGRGGPGDADRPRHRQDAPRRHRRGQAAHRGRGGRPACRPAATPSWSAPSSARSSTASTTRSTRSSAR